MHVCNPAVFVRTSLALQVEYLCGFVHMYVCITQTRQLARCFFFCEHHRSEASALHLTNKRSWHTVHTYSSQRGTKQNNHGTHTTHWSTNIYTTPNSSSQKSLTEKTAFKTCTKLYTIHQCSTNLSRFKWSEFTILNNNIKGVGSFISPRVMPNLYEFLSA